MVALLPCSAGAELGGINAEITVGSWLLAVAAGGCEARDVLPEKSVDEPKQ